MYLAGTNFLFLQIVKLDGGEYFSRAGSFNELRAVTNEQWDFLSQMIKSTKGSWIPVALPPKEDL